MDIAKALGLFIATALAEIVLLPAVAVAGRGASAWLVPAAAFHRAVCLAADLHPSAAGRVYAAYGASTSPWRWGGCGPWRARPA